MSKVNNILLNIRENYRKTNFLKEYKTWEETFWKLKIHYENCLNFETY